MWGQVAADSGFRIMAYDIPSATPWSPSEIPFLVSVRGEDADEIRGYWEKLSEGSTVIRPLEPAARATLYGMVKDRQPYWLISGTTSFSSLYNESCHPR